MKLELLTDYDMLLMVEEGIRGGICHSIHRHARANNKYMKNYDEKKESSYIQYLDTNNLYGWAMPQKLLVNGFKWVNKKHRDIKLVPTDKRRNKLVSEPNYHTMNYISEDLSIIEMNKTKVKTNKHIYLGLSILEISKLLMYEFWYDYMKPKYGSNVKLYYMDTDSFIINIKTLDFYKDIANDVEKRFDTSNYEVDRLLSIGKNKKIIGLMKDELGEKIIAEFVTLRPKTYSYLTDDCKEDKKAKGTKKCVIKRMIKFNDYKNCLLKDQVILKSQQRFISKKHDL